MKLSKLALALLLSQLAVAQPTAMPETDIQLCQAARKQFGELPERCASLRQGPNLFGETQRRNGGTCNQYGLWVWRQNGWVLVFQNLSLDGRQPTPKEQARLNQFQITSEVIRSMQKRTYIILDKAPAQWDLDVPYKIAPSSWQD